MTALPVRPAQLNLVSPEQRLLIEGLCGAEAVGIVGGESIDHRTANRANARDWSTRLSDPLRSTSAGGLVARSQDARPLAVRIRLTRNSRTRAADARVVNRAIRVHPHAFATQWRVSLHTMPRLQDDESLHPSVQALPLEHQSEHGRTNQTCTGVLAVNVTQARLQTARKDRESLLKARRCRRLRNAIGIRADSRSWRHRHQPGGASPIRCADSFFRPIGVRTVYCFRPRRSVRPVRVLGIRGVGILPIRRTKRSVAIASNRPVNRVPCSPRPRHRHRKDRFLPSYHRST